MKKTAMIFAFALLFFSCEKENNLIVENTDIPLISKVVVNGESFLEYSYNDANLISEEKNKYHYTKHNYNEANLLTSSEFYVDPDIFSSIMPLANREEWVNPDNSQKLLTKSYDYNDNNQLTRIIYSRPSVDNEEYSEFVYENGKVSRQNLYWEDKLSFCIDYVYTTKGNLIKESKYHIASTGIAELWTTTEYEFDDMKNPYLSFRKLLTPGKYTNQNNITEETYTLHFEVDQSVQKVSVIHNSYRYDHKGYPVKVNGEAEYVYR